MERWFCKLEVDLQYQSISYVYKVANCCRLDHSLYINANIYTHHCTPTVSTVTPAFRNDVQEEDDLGTLEYVIIIVAVVTALVMALLAAGTIFKQRRSQPTSQHKNQKHNLNKKVLCVLFALHVNLLFSKQFLHLYLKNLTYKWCFVENYIC